MKVRSGYFASPSAKQFAGQALDCVAQARAWCDRTRWSSCRGRVVGRLVAFPWFGPGQQGLDQT